jgi:hypothetical protein
VKEPVASAKAGIPKCLRRLRSSELVGAGDFVADEQTGIELWEGPNGFRADSFVKPIYRRQQSRAPATRKLK